MNEFQRKLLDIIGANSYFAAFAERGRTLLGIESYSYILNSANIGTGTDQGTIALNNLPMDSDSDFVLHSITGATLSGNSHGFNEQFRPAYNSACLVNFSDLSTGTLMFSAPVPLGMVAGTATYPWFLPRPYVFKPRSTLQVQCTGDPFTASDANPYSRIFVAFNGAKLYYA